MYEINNVNKTTCTEAHGTATDYPRKRKQTFCNIYKKA